MPRLSRRRADGRQQLLGRFSRVHPQPGVLLSANDGDHALIDRSRAPSISRRNSRLSSSSSDIATASSGGKSRSRTVYDLPDLSPLRCGQSTLKEYTPATRPLHRGRVAHNTSLPATGPWSDSPASCTNSMSILGRSRRLACVDQCFIAGDTLEQLPAPSRVGHTTVGGLDFNKPRTRHVAPGHPGRALRPAAFPPPTSPSASATGRAVCLRGRASTRGVRPQEVSRQRPPSPLWPHPPLRAVPSGGKRSPLAHPPRQGHSALARGRRGHGSQPRTTARAPLDRHYQSLRVGMQAVFHELGLAHD